MKKQKLLISLALVILIAILITAGIYYISTALPESSVKGDGFTPIFCNDYEFTCCGGSNQGGLGNVDLIKDQDYWRCPSTAIKCELKGSGSSSVQLFKGSQNCYVHTSWYGNKYFSCDDKREIPLSSTIYKNEYVWSSYGYNTYISYEIFSERLGFCGKSGVSSDEISCGVKVSGADGCKFNPQGNKIYPEGGGSAISTSSFTVPVGDCVLAFQSGNRHICGYKEETCSSNSDCTGHTYGNFECNGRTLQEYGCKTFGKAVPLEQDRLAGQDSDFGETSDESVFGKRCEIISAKTVQCCGDTDCGSNMFCDNSGTNPTWTCGSAKCKSDYDCGVSTQCDFSTKKLKTPKCSSGTCTYAEKDIECCYDADCPVGNFCNADKKCEKKIADCTQCQFECCDKECKADGGYFDRACPSEKPFCHTNTHTCSTEPYEQCKFTWWKLGLDGVFCKLKIWFMQFIIPLKWILIVLSSLISGIFSMLFARRRMEDLEAKKQWLISGIIGIIIAGGVFALAFFYWWVALIGLGVFGLIKLIF